MLVYALRKTASAASVIAFGVGLQVGVTLINLARRHAGADDHVPHARLARRLARRPARQPPPSRSCRSSAEQREVVADQAGDAERRCALGLVAMVEGHDISNGMRAPAGRADARSSSSRRCNAPLRRTIASRRARSQAPRAAAVSPGGGYPRPSTGSISSSSGHSRARHEHARAARPARSSVAGHHTGRRQWSLSLDVEHQHGLGPGGGEQVLQGVEAPPGRRKRPPVPVERQRADGLQVAQLEPSRGAGGGRPRSRPRPCASAAPSRAGSLPARCAISSGVSTTRPRVREVPPTALSERRSRARTEQHREREPRHRHHAADDHVEHVVIRRHRRRPSPLPPASAHRGRARRCAGGSARASGRRADPSRNEDSAGLRSDPSTTVVAARGRRASSSSRCPSARARSGAAERPDRARKIVMPIAPEAKMAVRMRR